MGDFLLHDESGAFSTYVTNFSNKSEANYLEALGYTESGGTAPLKSYGSPCCA